MKKIINGILLSTSALVFAAVPLFAQTTTTPTTTASPAAAQACNTAERDKLYKDVFLANYKGTEDQKKVAYDAAKEYVQKYNAPNCTDNADIIVYFLGDPNDPTKKGWIKKEEERREQVIKEAKIKRFNDAVAAGNAAEVFAAGKVLLTDYPNDTTNTSIMMFMVDNGFIQANKKVDTFNSETVTTAKATIERINAGKVPDANNWAPYKSKEDALAWLNYDLGYIHQFRMQNKKDAAPYFYQTTKFNSPDIAPSPVPYRAIGDWYLDQYTKAAEEYNAKKDDATVSEEDKNKLAGTWKAYADRAMEAYGYAYTKAKANPKTPEVAKEINDTLTQIYKLRHSGEATGLDAYVSGLSAKPITDPSTPVTPVVEATPTTATASIAATSGDSSTPTKTATSTPAKASDSTTKPATPTKKPAPKKGKGKK
ncbi:MAG: hypothetical protein ABI954_09505 [Pyrinomonadaceae bacterium]